MPWHLQANAGLSYRLSGASTQASLPGLMPLAGGDRQATSPPRVAAVIGNAEAAADATAEQFAHVQGGTADFVFTRAQHSTAMAAAADAAIPSRTAAATLLWPHRLLRWLADSDAGMTAWVRDYRLDPSQATQLIDSLRCLAEQQGHSLHRIMLNGHELWRSPSTPDLH